MSSLEDDPRRNRKRRVVNIIRADGNGTSDAKVEVMTDDPARSPPVAMERRKKPGEPGSSAPLLNYIFDTYSNQHQHNK